MSKTLENYLIDGYLPTIGIECHVQLKTVTKLFTGVSNDARDKAPNTTIGPLCIGLPGTLPVVNEHALELAIRAGHALEADIAKVTKFDRKHYFYPDLPLGYQISQFDQPIVGEGKVTVYLGDDKTTQIGIERAHLEADAGKLTHPDGADFSLADFNRAGTPLLEIVSRPDMHSAQEAKAYAQELYLRMLYADVSDCDLFHGNIRFDVNVSVGKDTSGDFSKLGTRTETKNLNSFRNVERVVEYEINRQINALEEGQLIYQETRGWDDIKQQTYAQRTKEDAHDYRYMPDPDIPPLEIAESVVKEQKRLLGLTPESARKKLSALGLAETQVSTIVGQPEAAKILNNLIEAHDSKTALTIAKWFAGELLRQVSESSLTWAQVAKTADHLVSLAKLVDEDKISSTNAKIVLERAIKEDKDPIKLAEDGKYLQLSDESDMVILVEKVFADNPDIVEQAKNDPKVIGFLVGLVMKASKGSANPAVTKSLIEKMLS